ncbi:hypothetical protein C8R46DRAFT_997275 [Mycena filopes]|nr:hypothetical protein C8R46DRAFT_997275 [Mycena filopes]
MASSSQCTGIAPNPDIAGIGVRVAIYVQALLSVIYPIVFAADGVITPEESKTMSRISINISLTACPLLVSTVIQAATLGISLYHMLIILQLSWINAMTFMTVYSVGAPMSMLAIKEWVDSGEGSFDRPTSFDQLRFLLFLRGAYPRYLRSPLLLVASAHYIAVGGVGLWTWNKIATFGNQPECNPDTFIVILSRSVYVTRSPEIRHVSLALYGISVIPCLNAVTFGYFLILIGAYGVVLGLYTLLLAQAVLGLTLVLPLLLILVVILVTGVGREGVSRSLARFLFPTPEEVMRRRHQIQLFRKLLLSYSGIASTVTAMSILIANTEQMIRRSRSIVQPGESDWTLGQTLALLLLFLPIGEAVRVIFGIDEETWVLEFFWGPLVVFFDLLLPA